MGSGDRSSFYMLAVPEKKGTPIDLVAAIEKYISSNYSDRDAEEAKDDLDTVQGWRTEVLAQSQGLDARKDILCKYFRALCSMETRFPISKEPNHAKIDFCWSDAVKTSKKATQTNIHFEKAAVLFNLGSVQSQLGNMADKTTDEGVKLACRNYQLAAGSFAHLRDSVSLKVSSGASIDIGKDSTNMLVWMLLAQAQECVHIKAVADNKSPGILAKLAKQTSMYYEETYAALTSMANRDHYDKGWAQHCGCKRATFAADAFFRQAFAFKAEEKIGHEIACLRQAQARLAEGKRDTPRQAQALEGLLALDALVAVELNVAMKENQCVYMEQIPLADALPAMSGHSMVKPLGMAEIMKGLESELFGSIVPEAATRALSKYTEMVDALSRQLATCLATMQEDTKLQLMEMELPDLLQAAEGNSRGYQLPEAVKVQIQDLHSKGGGGEVLQSMVEQIHDLRAATEDDLQAALRVLEDEEQDDGEMRARFKEAWTRPPSATLSAPLKERLAQYNNSIAAAEANDATLEARVSAMTQPLTQLHPDRVGSLLPPLQMPNLLMDDTMQAPMVAQRLKQLLADLEHTAEERMSLEDTLKETKNGDNILPKMMSCPDHEALFVEELAKYDTIKEKVAALSKRQTGLLEATKTTRAEFMAAFEVDKWRRDSEAAITNVKRLVEQHACMGDNLQDGMIFYTNLQDAIKKVSGQCSDYAFSRNLQRQDLRNDLIASTERKSAQEREQADDTRNRFSQMSVQRQHAPVPPPQHYAPPPQRQGPPSPDPRAPPPHGSYPNTSPMSYRQPPGQPTSLSGHHPHNPYPQHPQQPYPQHPQQPYPQHPQQPYPQHPQGHPQQHPPQHPQQHPPQHPQNPHPQYQRQEAYPQAGGHQHPGGAGQPPPGGQHPYPPQPYPPQPRYEQQQQQAPSPQYYQQYPPQQ